MLSLSYIRNIQVTKWMWKHGRKKRVMNSFRKRKTLEPIMRFSDAHFHPKSFWMLQMKWAREQNNNKQQQKKNSEKLHRIYNLRVPEKFVINFCCCSDCLFLVNKPFKIPVHVPICCANSTNLFLVYVCIHISFAQKYEEKKTTDCTLD